MLAGGPGSFAAYALPTVALHGAPCAVISHRFPVGGAGMPEALAAAMSRFWYSATCSLAPGSTCIDDSGITQPLRPPLSFVTNDAVYTPSAFGHGGPFGISGLPATVCG